jgi:hypothetical protein
VRRIGSLRARLLHSLSTRYRALLGVSAMPDGSGGAMVMITAQR